MRNNSSYAPTFAEFSHHFQATVATRRGSERALRLLFTCLGALSVGIVKLQDAGSAVQHADQQFLRAS